MSRILSWDPSTKSTGWAYYMHRSLIDAGVVRAKSASEMLWSLQYMRSHRFQPTHVVIERPEIYTPTQAKADPNKIAQVMLIAGACAMLFPYEHLHMPFPKEWKGQLPKDVVEARLEKKVGEVEWNKIQEILSKQLKGSRDDVADAIALNVWLQGRLASSS